MRYLSNIPALTIIIILLFVPFVSKAVEFQQNELTKAIQLFDKKQYAEAELLFEKILDDRPDDFMVNYFYGACRTENGHFSDRDLAFLLKASKEVSPLDIDYYYGVQYQAKGEFDKALLHYNTFNKTADEIELKRVNLAEKIEQCKNQVNPFTWISNAEVLPDSVLTNNDTVNIPEKAPQPEDSLHIPERANIVSDIIVDTLALNEYLNVDSAEITETEIPSQKPVSKDLPIVFSVNHEITYKRLSDFKTENGKQFYEQATDKKKELDTVLKTATSLREMYSSEKSRNVKDSLGQRILGLEDRSYDLKSEVNELFSISKLAENEYWDNATEDEKATFIAMQNSNKNKKKEDNIDADGPVSMEIPEILVDNSATIAKASEPANKDISYKIQIGAYSRGLPSSVKRLFDKLSLIRKIDNYTDENGVVVYTTGNLSNFGDAMTMLKQLQQEGVEDAIIAAYFKGKRIPLTEAKALEGI